MVGMMAPLRVVQTIFDQLSRSGCEVDAIGQRGPWALLGVKTGRGR